MTTSFCNNMPLCGKFNMLKKYIVTIFFFLLLPSSSIEVQSFPYLLSNSSSNNNNNTITTTTNNNNNNINNKNTMKLNIYQFCAIFNISRQNCTCESFNDGGSNGRDICEIMNRPVVVRTVYLKNYQYTYAILATVSSAIGIIGNALVILVAMSYNNRLPVVCNKLITHLAFYDLSFAIVQLINAVPKFWTEKWVYGEISCKIIRCAEYLGSMLAVGVILIICVERYLKILHPFGHCEVSGKKLQLVLLTNFILAVVAALPLFLYYRIDADLQYCQLKWPRKGNSITYNTTLFVFYFVIPVVIITRLYFKIICTIRAKNINSNNNNNKEQNKRAETKFTTADESSNDKTNANIQTNNNNSNNNNNNNKNNNNNTVIRPLFQQKRSQDSRIILSLVAVVIVFILFVFPRHIISIYLDSRGWNEDYISGEELGLDMYFYLKYIAQIPYIFHVAVNPVIYSLTDSRWRKSFKMLFSKLVKSHRAKSPNPGSHEVLAMSSEFPVTQHRTNTDILQQFFRSHIYK